MPKRWLAYATACLLSAAPALAASRAPEGYGPPLPSPAGPEELQNVQASVITGVRWTAGRLELTADAPLKARMLTLKQPDRVVVDLLDAELADPVLAQPLILATPPYRQLRIAEHHDSRFVRFVLDLEAPLPFELQSANGGQRMLARALESPLAAVSLAYGPPAPMAAGPDLPTAAGPHPRPIAETRQVLAEVRLRPARGKEPASLNLVSAATLSCAISLETAPSRLVVRVPGGRAEKLPKSVKAWREGPDLLLAVSLAEGYYQVERRMTAGGRGVALRWRPQELSLAKRPMVLLDPGHGGGDPGAIGPAGTWESTVTLALARRVQAVLQESYKVQALLTRTEDLTLALASRTQMSEELSPDLLVSIHANSCETPTVAGTETFYRNPSSLPLARHLHQTMVAELKRPDRGVRQARLYVLRSPSLPSALVESAYISNPEEERLLASEAFQQQVAEAIAKGIASYLVSPPLAELP